MFFDIHAHYDDERYDKDRDYILGGLQDKGVKYVINSGADIDSSVKSIEYSEKYDYIYATCGIHPGYVSGLREEDLEKLKELSKHSKVVAIGEIGLDYYYDTSNKEQQKYWFRKQVDIAKELKLPVVIHNRDAHEDTMKELKRAAQMGVKGVMHCYSGSVEMAKEIIKLGFYISIGGVITFKNAKKLPDVVEWLPIEYLLLETDCPYLAPEPFRGKRNDSSMLRYIANKIAQIKGITCEEVCKITTENACRLFFY
jgi:TatD DNase family protein